MRFLINQSANVLVFGDFNIHCKDWLSYSGRIDGPGEHYYNFYISNDLTQMVRFHTWIPDFDCHNSTLFNFFLSSDASICSTMTFPLCKNSDHVFSVSIDFLSDSKWDACFIIKLLTILILIGMVFVSICEMLHTIFLNSVLLLLLVNFMSGFRYLYPSLQISGQASLILIVFSCLCCCHSS